MAKIPFSIDYRPQIESGEYKVETNDHHPVRIICWNKNTGGLDRIVALVAGGSGQEKTLHYTEEGLCVASGGNKNKDLFIITPESELSEFEQELESFYNHHLQVCTYDNQGTVEDSLHDGALKLLELARKEIIDGWSRGLRDTQCLSEKAYNDGYQLGFEQGKAEALKDLPRWNRLYSKENADKIPDCIIPGKALDNRLVHRGFELKITDLEKLPGFNEDEK